MVELAASVIVCTRNRANYLVKCLETLLQQDCREKFETVIVDNASTDDTPRVIEEWCLKHSRVRYVRESRIGLSAAKNAGAQAALGRFLLFTDDDVLVHPRWVDSYLDLFARVGQHNIIAGGPIIPILDNLSSWPQWFHTAALPEIGLLDYESERSLLPWEYVWGANMAIPSSVFRTIGPWDEELGRRGEHRGTFEDTEYQDRLRTAGGSVWFCPGASIQHRVERERIAPRTLMSRAFGRGRNEYLRDLLRSRGTIENPPRENGVLGLLATLTVTLTKWIVWTCAFSVVKRQATFRRSHSAAFSSGKNLERVRAGRESDAPIGWAIRLAFFMRRVALSLTRRAAE
jgi:glucosyl-dolichyl phosphate glucuronosyltransferase